MEPHVHPAHKWHLCRREASYTLPYRAPVSLRAAMRSRLRGRAALACGSPGEPGGFTSTPGRARARPRAFLRRGVPLVEATRGQGRAGVGGLAELPVPAWLRTGREQALAVSEAPQECGVVAGQAVLKIGKEHVGSGFIVLLAP